MEDMEAKLGDILSNPEAMQKIMALAQSLNQSDSHSAPEPTAKAQEAMAPVHSSPPPALPQGIDFSMLQKLSGFSQRSAIDKNQQSLLRALSPYLSRQRISKLEKAMQAAKMAQMASTMLGGAQFNSGR